MDGPVDLLVVGARVWTGDLARPRASAVGVRGGRVAFVGSDDRARRLAGAETDVIEAPGEAARAGVRRRAQPRPAGI
jgi:predicted amidohydrolase YtcJ